MSVSVEQPLHFTQPPSSPPPFSSPPQSPNHILHTQTPVPPLPLPPADVDMSSSVTTLPAAGQRHDREDADMQDSEGLAETAVENALETPSHSATPTAVAVQVAVIDDDAMDTTPDSESAPPLPNGTVHEPTAAVVSPTSPADPRMEPATEEQPPPVAPIVDATQAGNAPPAVPPPLDLSQQPPPPPPPPPAEPVRSDSDSSDDDDGLQPWHPIQEDRSSPDADELKEIEASTEHSALDHEYWESKAFLPLEEPEYSAGATGRIHWNIEAYNGTKEKPNREVVMKSEPVTVGGHQWQIKFYPKGNDSDYLSVYLECLTVTDQEKKQEKSEDEVSKEGQKKDDVATNNESADTSTKLPPADPRHSPLPLLGNKSLPKRKSVAAQVSVVLYNPTEPRINYSRTALHRFCDGSPDWGWTRFHGPYYDIPHRMRGQRQALLRDDKLAFTGYIRIVEDETECLWEHHSRDNAWDSYAMTGLQSLMLGEDTTAFGGNLISAVSLWLLFKPFRKLLYDINSPDPDQNTFVRPKLLLGAFQKVLFMLRTYVDPGAGSVTLDDILDALEWYGVSEPLDKLDVMEVWEILRTKLEEELQDTAYANHLEMLFGPKRDYTVSPPSCRVPVVGVETMQQAVNQATTVSFADGSYPQLLTIELNRQEFDTKTRTYVKLLNKVTLDDSITIGSVDYKLYAFVVHKQALQSYVYQPVVRPEGPGSKWYSYSDSREENQVRCLTKRQAIDNHEGKPGSDRIVGNDEIAYIALYIRADVATTAFISNAESDRWDVPEWVRVEVENVKSSSVNDLPPPPTMEPAVMTKGKVSKDNEENAPAEMLDFHIIDSRIFADYEGPGVFEAYDPAWESGMTDLVIKTQLSTTDGCKEIREKLASLLKDIKDPRQITFWFLDPSRGTYGRPQFLGTGKTEYSRGNFDRYTNKKDWTLEELPIAYRRIWVHVLDVAALPELPKVEEKVEEEKSQAVEPAALPASTQSDASETTTSTEAVTTAAGTVPDAVPANEDTQMSEPEAETAPPAEPAPVPTDTTEQTPPSDAQSGDTAMMEAEVPTIPDPPSNDTPAPPAPAPIDTEMGGTQDNLPPPPPPPPLDLPSAPAQPPPPERIPSPQPPPDEIYFFLKFWSPTTQRLESRGSHICLKSARVDETVVALLGLPAEDKKKLDLVEEDETSSTRALKHRRSFAQLDLHNTCIIIAALPLSADQRTELATNANFADPAAYLAYRARARNFAHLMHGTFHFAHFSREAYSGTLTKGQRHGTGTLTYDSGAVYTGSFVLGTRHGTGTLTHHNGDIYTGSFVANAAHGTGSLTEAASGNVYTGGWRHDKRHGRGVTHWANAAEAERLCRICWEEEADAAFVDCGHVVACLGCAREVGNCPVCRRRVVSALRLFWVA